MVNGGLLGCKNEVFWGILESWRDFSLILKPKHVVLYVLVEDSKSYRIA